MLYSRLVYRHVICMIDKRYACFSGAEIAVIMSAIIGRSFLLFIDFANSRLTSRYLRLQIRTQSLGTHRYLISASCGQALPIRL